MHLLKIASTQRSLTSTDSPTSSRVASRFPIVKMSRYSTLGLDLNFDLPPSIEQRIKTACGVIRPRPKVGSSSTDLASR
jgi:hypothetical protein